MYPLCLIPVIVNMPLKIHKNLNTWSLLVNFHFMAISYAEKTELPFQNVVIKIRMGIS